MLLNNLSLFLRSGKRDVVVSELMLVRLHTELTEKKERKKLMPIEWSAGNTFNKNYQ